jgi:hypothetical protein
VYKCVESRGLSAAWRSEYKEWCDGLEWAKGGQWAERLGGKVLEC